MPLGAQQGLQPLALQAVHQPEGWLERAWKLVQPVALWALAVSPVAGLSSVAREERPFLAALEQGLPPEPDLEQVAPCLEVAAGPSALAREASEELAQVVAGSQFHTGKLASNQQQ